MSFENVLPEDWKIAVVIPFYKSKGERNKNIRNLPATKGHWTHQGCWIKKKKLLLLSIYINKPHPTHDQSLSA